MYLIVRLSSNCGDGVDAFVGRDFSDGLLCCKSSFDLPPLRFRDDARSGDPALESSSSDNFEVSS